MDFIHIPVPKPKKTDEQRMQISAEMAFNNLILEAKKQGLVLSPVLGLVYLPDQEVTKQFQEACRSVLELLRNE